MNRIFWVDCARFVAILMVVLTHAHEQSNVSNETMKSLLYCFDRIGVPIFFMLSGGLILPKIHSIPVLSFYRKRIPQFIILLVTYSVLSNTVHGVTNGEGLLAAFTSSVIKYNGIYPANYGVAVQLWFMYSIIQLYLIAPFLSRLISKLETSDIIILLLLCVLFSFIKHTILVADPDWKVLIRMGDDFTGPYIAYFLTGYLIMNREWDLHGMLKNKIFNIMLLITPVVIVMSIEQEHGKMIHAFHWYTSSFFIYVSSVGVICLIKVVCEGKNNKVISTLGEYSFGIYLIHFVFISFALLLSTLAEMNWVWSTVTLFIIPMGLSVIYTHLMFKTRLTKYMVS